MSGRLSIVGIGMVVPEHVTEPVVQEIREADWVGHLLDDEHKLEWLESLHPQSEVIESLYRFYSGQKDRQETYQEIAQRVVEEAQRGRRACLVSYGHPLVYCQPSLFAVERARQLQLDCRVVPAISSQDCLLADLNVDVASYGFVAMEAHVLTSCEVTLDPQIGLILWQISLVGEFQAPQGKARHRGYLQLLGRILGRYYPADHPAYVYLAATRPGARCSIRATTIGRLHEATYDWLSTLYVPPLGVSLPAHLLDPRRDTELTLLGLGAEVSLTQRCRGLVTSAARVFSLDLPGGELEVLHQLRGDCQPWNSAESFRRDPNPGPTVVVCSGHPCYIDSAMELLRQGLEARVEPAISRDDVVYGDLLLDPFDFGYQVRTMGQLARPDSYLDTTYSTLYLGQGPPGAVEVGPSQFFQRGRAKPAASQEMAYEVYLARAAESLRRELERLPSEDYGAWRRAMGAKEDAPLLELSQQAFYQRVFAEATRSGVDLARAEQLEEHRRTQPDSFLSRYFRLYQWATAAREAFGRGYTLAPVRELLTDL